MDLRDLMQINNNNNNNNNNNIRQFMLLIYFIFLIVVCRQRRQTTITNNQLSHNARATIGIGVSSCNPAIGDLNWYDGGILLGRTAINEGHVLYVARCYNSILRSRGSLGLGVMTFEPFDGLHEVRRALDCRWHVNRSVSIKEQARSLVGERQLTL